MNLSITIKDATFIILSKTEFLGRIIINLQSSIGQFSVYSSLSDGGSFKLCTFVPYGHFYKRDDSYIYGHAIHHQLTSFIYENINDIPISTTVPNNYCTDLMKKSAPEYIYNIMSDENIPQHHIIFDAIHNSITAYAQYPIKFENSASKNSASKNSASKNSVPEHLLFKKSNKTPFDELLYIIFKYYYDRTIDKNYYDVLSMTMCTYLNLFLNHIDLNNIIKESKKSKNAFVFKDGNAIIDGHNKSVTIVVDTYEINEYKCFFKIPSHEELTKICAHSNIPIEIITGSITKIVIDSAIEPVIIVTQSYVYAITDNEKGINNIIEENNITIPSIVLKSNYNISLAGTYVDYILCGGYVFKPFDYLGQLLSPSEYAFKVGSSTYGLVLNKLKNLWSPIPD